MDCFWESRLSPWLWLYPGWPAGKTEGKWQPQKGRFEFEEGGKKKYTKTDHIPLRADRDHPPGVLLIEQDITEFIVERERREKMFRGLIDAFAGEIDARQAEAARNNGKLIAKLARGAAEEMGLNPSEVETAELAGELLNLGTISLPGRTGEGWIGLILKPNFLEGPRLWGLFGRRACVPTDTQIDR